MTKHTIITQDLLKQLLDYDSDTGIFTWKERAVDLFKDDGRLTRHQRCKQWNSKNAGKKCGSITQGYVNISLFGKLYRAHILAWFYMTGVWPECEIDHQDGDSTNNAYSNLRLASRSENMGNSGKRINNPGKYKGAHYHKNTGKWQAKICFQRKQIYLGLHDTPKEAHAAYCKAAKELFGEFARAS
jgi:hypothetical protein